MAKRMKKEAEMAKNDAVRLFLDQQSMPMTTRRASFRSSLMVAVICDMATFCQILCKHLPVFNQLSSYVNGSEQLYENSKLSRVFVCDT